MNSKMKEIIIYGCGGHSRSVADVILFNEPEARLVFVDDSARENEEIFGFKVVKSFPQKQHNCFLAIGDNTKRKKIYDEMKEANLISVVSKQAYLGHSCKIGIGCFLGHFCHVGSETIIGSNAILNTAAIVSHEVEIGQYCHIAPNATISGRTKIGDLVFIGVGATVKNKINICSNVIIGAGATVVKDITEPGIYVGTPAKRIK